MRTNLRNGNPGNLLSLSPPLSHSLARPPGWAGEASLTVDFEFDWSQVQLLIRSSSTKIVYGISQLGWEEQRGEREGGGAAWLASINHERCLSDFYCFLSNPTTRAFPTFPLLLLCVYFHLIDIFACLGKFCALFICWISAVKPATHTHTYLHTRIGSQWSARQCWKCVNSVEISRRRQTFWQLVNSMWSIP